MDETNGWEPGATVIGTFDAEPRYECEKHGELARANTFHITFAGDAEEIYCRRCIAEFMRDHFPQVVKHG